MEKILNTKVLKLDKLLINNITKFHNKTFEDIFITIFNLTKSIYGIWLLCVYDITTAIGNGLKRTIKLLNVIYKLQKINTFKLHNMNTIIDKKLKIICNICIFNFWCSIQILFFY